MFIEQSFYIYLLGKRKKIDIFEMKYATIYLTQNWSFGFGYNSIYNYYLLNI